MSANVVPARLSYLTLYSPLLSKSDETRKDEIVFYYDRERDEQQRKKGSARDNVTYNTKNEEQYQNEELRQVGLAQGMVEFAKSFADGETIDAIDTEKHCVVLTELESGWWILASIELTRLNRSTESSKTSFERRTDAKVEYSSREVSPSALLLQQLRRAYRAFLLHHGPSFSEIFVRVKRERFCALAARFWTQFARSWDVLLHGNPTVEVYGGIKLAAGGELGIGVGEEAWGSAARDSLEGLIRETEGLVDVMVSRFGEVPEPLAASEAETSVTSRAWLGTDQHSGCADGLIFSGIGALTRQSIRVMTEWSEDIFMHGDEAYGVKDNPNSTRRIRRKVDSSRSRALSTELPGCDLDTGPNGPRDDKHSNAGASQSLQKGHAARVPPPMVVEASKSSSDKTSSTANLKASSSASENTAKSEDSGMLSALTDSNTWVNVLTLGYRSWGYTGSKNANDSPSTTNTKDGIASLADSSIVDFAIPSVGIDSMDVPVSNSAQGFESIGHFLIGLKGNLDSVPSGTVNLGPEDETSDGSTDNDWANRLSLRTLHLTLHHPATPPKPDSSGDESPSSHDSSSTEIASGAAKRVRLRVIIYAHQPFIYSLLFSPTSSYLAMPAFFSTLHRTLSRLRPGLLDATAPNSVAKRMHDALMASNCLPPTSNATSPLPVSTLIHDPDLLTVHASVPNIPRPGTLAAEGFGYPAKSTSTSAPPLLAAAAWSRIDALHVHSHCLATYASTRVRSRFGGGRGGESSRDMQRTAKTTRGFGVVWMRFPATAVPVHERVTNEEMEIARDTTRSYREAILVRRSTGGGDGSAGGMARPNAVATSGGWSRFTLGLVGGGDADVGGVAGELTDAVGVDVKKYVETLLSLSR